MAFVYITTNLINGKKYLGKHNGNNSNYLGSGTLLKQAINKYGKENFKLEKIYDNLSDENAFEIEKNLSIELNIVESDEWYNLKFGGEGFSSGKLHPMYGVPKSDSHRKKLSQANLGKKYSDERNKKISLSMTGSGNPLYGIKGENHPSFGHKKTEECKKRISESKKGKLKSKECIEKIKNNRKGKGIGTSNAMSNPKNVEKVRQTKIGRKRIYREDGSFYMSPRNDK